MQNYKNSAAYDFELFEIDGSNTVIAPKRQNKAVIQPIPVKRVKKNIRSTVAKVSVSLAILFMVCFNIYTRVAINETSNSILKADKQLDVLDSERVTLEMQMKKQISYKNIEEEAKKFGMQKKEKSQIHYIKISEGNKAEIIDLKTKLPIKDKE